MSDQNDLHNELTQAGFCVKDRWVHPDWPAAGWSLREPGVAKGALSSFKVNGITRMIRDAGGVKNLARLYGGGEVMVSYLLCETWITPSNRKLPSLHYGREGWWLQSPMVEVGVENTAEEAPRLWWRFGRSPKQWSFGEVKEDFRVAISGYVKEAEREAAMWREISRA